MRPRGRGVPRRISALDISIYTDAQTWIVPSRTISLEQSAYERLAAAKRPGESFSEVVNRLTSRSEPSLLDLVGILPADTADELKEVLATRRRAQADLADQRRRGTWPEA